MRTQLAKQSGFTLIELMIVVVVIGILAAFAVNGWHTQRADAIVASMKSDLHNIATAEEAYFSDNNTYASDVDDLDVNTSPGVVITLQADVDGWAANASHPSASRECGLYVGKIAPLSPARGEGIVWCE